MIGALLLGSLALGASDPEQTLLFQVAAPSNVVFQEIVVEIERVGQTRTIPLVDDGSVASDLPWDGVYVGRDVGPYTRWLPVRILARWEGRNTLPLYAGIEKSDDPHLVSLGWQVRGDGTSLEARRAAAGWPGNRMVATEGLFMLGSLAWTLVVMTWVGFLVVDRKRGTP